MPSAKLALSPKKMPVQARSTFTVESIFTATIQVLRDVGLERLTTTRVAERAGTSVGTLYQYFPNKNALLLAVLERHLLFVVQSIENACKDARCKPIADIAATLVNAFVDAKLHDVDASVALIPVRHKLGEEMVVRYTQRVEIAICDVLMTAQDVKFGDLRTIAFILTKAALGPVQALLETGAHPVLTQAVRGHLIVMINSYLRSFMIENR